MVAALVATSAAPVPAEQAQYLTFTVGKELLGLGILAVKEIIEYQTLTVVPMMPPAVRGVINLRGAVVPVIDLSVRLGKEPADVSKRTCIVIVELKRDGEQLTIGALVDAVNQVLEIPASEIEPTPSFGTKIRRDFIRGMGKVNGKFVVLLDAEHVLTFEDVEALQELNRAPARD
ncbi:MAG TPA: chemotaxis protein CheW [Polyangiaceae bacterium]|nr:chemotaxis protein CheW [Polyangiaceae bacterium]